MTIHVHVLRMAGIVGPLLLLLSVVSHAAPPAPTEVVRTTVDEVIRVLSDAEWKKPDRFAERRKLLERLIGQRFDYEEMAKRALARHWLTLNEKERTEFVGLFAAFLSASYADKIESYTSERVEYLNERLSDGYAEVRTKIISSKTEYPLDYRLLNKGNEWYVYDVVVDGISLVKNYRGQFDRTIRSSSYQKLVETLRQKVEENKVRRSPH